MVFLVISLNCGVDLSTGGSISSKRDENARTDCAFEVWRPGRLVRHQGGL